MLGFVGHWLWEWVIGWGGVGFLISLAAWALWYFTPSFLTGSKSTILQIAIGATLVTVASTYFFSSGYSLGYQVAINQVAARNKEAADAVNKATSQVDACIAAGREWDTSSGVCK